MKQSNQNALIVVIVSVLTILFWVGFEVVRSYYTSTITQVVEEQIKVLNPKIDVATLKSLSDRIHISEEELTNTIEQQKTIIPHETENKVSSSSGAQITNQLKSTLSAEIP